MVSILLSYYCEMLFLATLRFFLIIDMYLSFEMNWVGVAIVPGCFVPDLDLVFVSVEYL